MTIHSMNWENVQKVTNKICVFLMTDHSYQGIEGIEVEL